MILFKGGNVTIGTVQSSIIFLGCYCVIKPSLTNIKEDWEKNLIGKENDKNINISNISNERINLKPNNDLMFKDIKYM